MYLIIYFLFIHYRMPVFKMSLEIALSSFWFHKSWHVLTIVRFFFFFFEIYTLTRSCKEKLYISLVWAYDETYSWLFSFSFSFLISSLFQYWLFLIATSQPLDPELYSTTSWTKEVRYMCVCKSVQMCVHMKCMLLCGQNTLMKQ